MTHSTGKYCSALLTAQVYRELDFSARKLRKRSDGPTRDAWLVRSQNSSGVALAVLHRRLASDDVQQTLRVLRCLVFICERAFR